MPIDLLKLKSKIDKEKLPASLRSDSSQIKLAIKLFSTFKFTDKKELKSHYRRKKFSCCTNFMAVNRNNKKISKEEKKEYFYVSS